MQASILEEGETIRWEARPAPRCYTFRHWRHSVFGLIFLAICSYWQFLGLSLAETYAVRWLAWIPLPFVLIGLYFFVGHLLHAGFEWNHVNYVITDRRVIAQRGLTSPRTQFIVLSEITYCRLHRQGEQLGTLRVHKGREQSLVLHCIEYPHLAMDLLAEAIARNEAQKTK